MDDDDRHDRDDDAVAAIAILLRDARQVVLLTGAGISTESGVPDFRGPQGVWTKNPAAERAATLQHYLADPEVREQAWRSRLDSPLWDAEPNEGHRAVAALEHLVAFHTLVTQNIDGLHQAAGSDPGRIIEIHGNVREAKCVRCGWHGPMADTLERVRAGETDPACIECGGILKSATISFGEQLVASDLRRAQEAASGADVFLAVGTSLVVYPAAALPEVALAAGTRLVVMNGEPTPFDPVAEVVVREPLGAALRSLVGRLTQTVGNRRPNR